MRYRVNLAGLPGRPDLAFTRARLAVFIDGCFWHRCPEHGTMPKNNQAWWAEKLQANVDRDLRVDRELAALGWAVLHVWEHETANVAADRIMQAWRDRLDPTGDGGRAGR
jgi:DNA mismatch endonuclease (patch repair protein)